MSKVLCRASSFNTPHHISTRAARWALLRNLSSSPSDLSEARSWLSRFTVNSIPPAICHFSFSRSSGPGGQNVNKSELPNRYPQHCANAFHRMSSKATLKVSLDQLLPLLPSLTHQALRDSRYYARNSNSIVIHADESRRQSENSHKCLLRLHGLICDIAREAIPGETSDAQKKKVKKLLVQQTHYVLDLANPPSQAAYQKHRLQEKKLQSIKKGLRRSSFAYD
jgi:peptidyl-tRNA hydrolase ICT1